MVYHSLPIPPSGQQNFSIGTATTLNLNRRSTRKTTQKKTIHGSQTLSIFFPIEMAFFASYIWWVQISCQESTGETTVKSILSAKMGDMKPGNHNCCFSTAVFVLHEIFRQNRRVRNLVDQKWNFWVTTHGFGSLKFHLGIGLLIFSEQNLDIFTTFDIWKKTSKCFFFFLRFHLCKDFEEPTPEGEATGLHPLEDGRKLGWGDL